MARRWPPGLLDPPHRRGGKQKGAAARLPEQECCDAFVVWADRRWPACQNKASSVPAIAKARRAWLPAVQLHVAVRQLHNECAAVGQIGAGRCSRRGCW
ncbi:hypothetical protein PSNTI_24750 [Stutzerimonas stutzeri]|nr:hypothetical protein PSNTI_24750 [Stutzerimonas stutzeri]